jgi:hypothetical protein
MTDTCFICGEEIKKFEEYAAKDYGVDIEHVHLACYEKEKEEVSLDSIYCSVCKKVIYTDSTYISTATYDGEDTHVIDYFHYECFSEGMGKEYVNIEKAYSQEDWQEDVTEVCEDIKSTLISKNQKYGGSKPLRCFSKYKVRGILVRLEDKLNRIENFLEQHENGENVDMEVIRDAFRDIAGYSISGTIVTKELY